MSFLANFLDRFEELAAINSGFFNTREQIRDDILEERQIIFEELGHVNVTQSSQKKLTFVHLLELGLQDTGSVDN